MKILALIPARGGSKRLPGKNARMLGNKPMLVWSIDAAKGIPEICDTLVSTDDQAIADIAQLAGALVPWLRPEELSTDAAPSIDVALHALDWYESTHGAIDGLMLLQPTSPFRTAETIKQAIDVFSLKGGKPVIGVSPAASHPAWCYRIESDSLVPYATCGEEKSPQRSQDLPPAYALNGAMYLAKPAYLRTECTFAGADAYPLLIQDPAESLDIDTAHDFMIAECVAARMGDFSAGHSR
jgi:CMP-N-acetylneuraminic acid synthetase